MNISDSKVHQYKDKTIVIDDPRIIKGSLTLAQVWGSSCIGDSGDGAEELEEAMTKFAEAASDIREKYEVNGDLLNGESEFETAYFDELNTLLNVYRFQIFNAAMNYVTSTESIDLMLDLMR